MHGIAEVSDNSGSGDDDDDVTSEDEPEITLLDAFNDKKHALVFLAAL